MQMLGKYVLSLSVVALSGSILLSLFPDGKTRALIRFVLGIVLTVTALSPLTDIQIPDFQEELSAYIQSGLDAAEYGEALAKEERHQLIKHGLEAYILDKAAALALDVDADIQLNDEGIPVSIQLSGDSSAEQRRQLSAAITKDLGIPEEDQRWTGQTGKIP